MSILHKRYNLAEDSNVRAAVAQAMIQRAIETLAADPPASETERAYASRVLKEPANYVPMATRAVLGLLEVTEMPTDESITTTIDSIWGALAGLEVS